MTILRILTSILLAYMVSASAIAQDTETDPEAMSEDFFSAEDSPVSEQSTTGQQGLTAPRPWRSPDFSGQEQALGYSSLTFAVPAGLNKNYKFWLDIYTKYSTDEGLIHDSEYIDLVYQVLDFRPIMTKAKWGPNRKDVEKHNLVNRTKKKWISVLKRFAKLQAKVGAEMPTDLDSDQQRVWAYFQQIPDKNKFKDAQNKKRLRFQLGQRDRFIQAIFFSGRYLEDFESIFREAGLPIELTRLPFVESSYNVLARSKVGASGLWQIMPETAKPFVTNNRAIDLRNHPVEAAIIASKFLKQSYQFCKSWSLALTGYNHGPGGIMKLSKKYRSLDIGELVTKVKKSSAFGFASKNFFASFLAVLEVERNAPKYFGNVNWSSPLDSVDLRAPRLVSYKELVRWFENDDLRTQIYNPHITIEARKGKVKIPKQSLISVPRAKFEWVMEEINKAGN